MSFFLVFLNSGASSTLLIKIINAIEIYSQYRIFSTTLW